MQNRWSYDDKCTGLHGLKLGVRARPHLLVFRADSVKKEVLKPPRGVGRHALAVRHNAALSSHRVKPGGRLGLRRRLQSRPRHTRDNDGERLCTPDEDILPLISMRHLLVREVSDGNVHVLLA